MLIGCGSADVDAVADRLLTEWPNLPALLSARRDRLMSVACDARVVAAIIRFRDALRHTLRTRLRSRAVINSVSTLYAYLRTELAYLQSEEMRVLYLTGRNHLIRDEVSAFGTLDECKGYPREVVRRALELGAANLILVHNHPSGDREPSRSDVAFTKRLQAIASGLDICVLDHIVVAAEGCTSMRKAGLL